MRQGPLPLSESVEKLHTSVYAHETGMRNEYLYDADRMALWHRYLKHLQNDFSPLRQFLGQSGMGKEIVHTSDSGHDMPLMSYAEFVRIQIEKGIQGTAEGKDAVDGIFDALSKILSARITMRNLSKHLREKDVDAYPGPDLAPSINESLVKRCENAKKKMMKLLSGSKDTNDVFLAARSCMLLAHRLESLVPDGGAFRVQIQALLSQEYLHEKFRNSGMAGMKILGMHRAMTHVVESTRMPVEESL